jgi:hypothetical protein
MKKIYVPVVLLFFYTLSVAQDSTFNSFNNGVFTNFYTNPAFAGSEKNLNLHLNGSDFYLKLNDIVPYQLIAMGDMAFGKKKQFGFGITYIGRETNTMNIKQLVTSFSGSAEVFSRTTISYGLAFSPFFKVSSDKFIGNNVFPDQFNPVLGTVYPTSEILCVSNRSVSIIGNMTGGIWVDNPRYFLGISFGHFHLKKIFLDNKGKTEEKTNLAVFPISITTGYNYKINDFIITPNIFAYLYEMDNKNKAMLSIGITGTYRNKYLLSFSGFNRSGMFDITAGIYFSRRYKVMASYGMFRNIYLRNITGAAYIDLGFNIQLTKR